jgi:hypothetical protein
MSDQRIQSTEEMVGAGHATKSDTLNRLTLVEHNNDGTHKAFTAVQINDTSGDHQYIVIVSELTADRNVTLPLLAGADEFVFKDHAVELKNKTIVYANNILTGFAAQGLQTIWIPASAMISRSSNGAAAGSVEMATNKNMFKTLDFDAAVDEFAQFAIQMPKSWNLETITAEMVWSHAATMTNFGVAWFIQGVAISNDDAGDVAFGTAVGSVDTGGTTNDIYISPTTSAITIDGSPAANDYVMFQIYRDVSDGGDTMSIDARLHGVQIYYTTNAATD